MTQYDSDQGTTEERKTEFCDFLCRAARGAAWGVAMSVLQRVEKSLAAGSGLSSSAAVEAVLLLSSMVKQQCYLSDVVAAIRLLSLVFLDAGDNFLRAAIVEALKKVGQFDFPQSAAALLAPIVRVVSDLGVCGLHPFANGRCLFISLIQTILSLVDWLFRLWDTCAHSFGTRTMSIFASWNGWEAIMCWRERVHCFALADWLR